MNFTSLFTGLQHLQPDFAAEGAAPWGMGTAPIGSVKTSAGLLRSSGGNLQAVALRIEQMTHGAEDFLSQDVLVLRQVGELFVQPFEPLEFLLAEVEVLLVDRLLDDVQSGLAGSDGAEVIGLFGNDRLRDRVHGLRCEYRADCANVLI